MYSLLLALIYIAFISLGLPDSLLGSGWPVIHNDLNVPISFMGVVSMVISGGTIVSSLFSDKLTRKLGARIVTVSSVFLTAVALFGFSFSDRFWMLIVFAVPYGLGAGAIDAALNNYVALHYASKHMSWLHCFWGVGTIVSPFVMSYALTNSTWNQGYRIVGFIQLGIALLLLATLPVWKVHQNTNGHQETKSLGLTGALKIKGVPFLLIGFFAYCAAEATAMSWASTYFVEVKGINTERAAEFASLFYIGITVGRFISGFDLHFVLRSHFSADSHELRDRIADRIRRYRIGLRANLSLYHPFHARQFRRGKFGGDHRHPNGERLCRLDVDSSALRASRQFNRLQNTPRLSLSVYYSDDYDDGINL